MVETEIAAPPTTDRTVLAPLTQTSGTERMFPTLTAEQIARIAAHGHVRPMPIWRGAHRGGRAGRAVLRRYGGSGRDCPAIRYHAKRSSRSMDRVSSPAKSTCFQAAPRSSERAPASRAK